MRRFHKLFLTGGGYTVLILALFYSFAAISNFVSPAITLGQFGLIIMTLFCNFVGNIAVAADGAGIQGIAISTEIGGDSLASNKAVEVDGKK